jgi:hypothetical protein
VPLDDQSLRLLAFLLAAQIGGVKVTAQEVLQDAIEIYEFLSASEIQRQKPN